MKAIPWVVALMLFSFSVVLAQDSILIMSDDYEPYTSSQKQGSGVILDIVRQAFATNDILVKYKFAPWKRCEKMVETGEVFGAIPYFKTQERLQNYNFSDPIIYSYDTFFYNKKKFPKGYSWKTLEDFQGYRMGGILGYWYMSAFERAGLTVDEVRSDKQNLEMLIAQRIDFTVIDKLTGMQLLREHFSGDMQMIGVLDKPESFLKFYVMVSRTYPKAVEFTEKLNHGLKQLKASGDYHIILEQYRIPVSFAVP